jgi:hypothetical protein
MHNKNGKVYLDDCRQVRQMIHKRCILCVVKTKNCRGIGEGQYIIENKR